MADNLPQNAAVEEQPIIPSAAANNVAEPVDEQNGAEAAIADDTTAAVVQLSEADILAGLKEQDSNLIDIINSMEADRKKFLAHVRSKISCKETEFEKTKSDNDRLKARIAEMELCLRQNNIDFVSAASTTKPNKAANKQQGTSTEDILTQAKALLFEKTKICKQQEQQLAALKTQVEATKEVLAVTKEMLCLRNIENDHTQARLETLDLKLKTERARQALTERKCATAQTAYSDLRAEYDKQSGIFKLLRVSYEEKIAALAKQLEAAKA